MDQRWQFHGARRRTRPDHRTSGKWSDLHDPERAAATPHPRHRHVQRASRGRVLLHAEPVRPEMAGRARWRRGGPAMTQTFVRYSPDVEQIEPDFEKSLETTLDAMKK